MNKSILMSIRPEWLVKILNGEKTIEIRKSMPKCDLPIDVYLYCTKEKPYLYENWDGRCYKLTRAKTWQERANEEDYTSVEMFSLEDYGGELNGKVVAKFTLNKIEDCCDMSATELELKSKLSIDEICDYIKAKEVDPKIVYAWNIDNLVIFDKPKELRDFSIFKRETISCGMDCPPYTDWVEYRVRKSPQSWQYAWLWEK